MKLRNLLSYFLAVLCCGGMLFADSKKEEGKRVPIGVTQDLNEAALAKEERVIRALDIAESFGEDTQSRAIATAPVEESTLASKAAVGNSSTAVTVANQMSTASGISIVNYPGAFHPVIRFLGSEVRLDDGSWWKVYSGDVTETYNWLTDSSLSILDKALGLTADTVVVTANTDWPLHSSYRYHLTNQKTGKYVRAQLSDFYFGSNTRYINSNVWLYDAYGNLYVQLTLDDGSIWNTLAADTHCLKWKNGDIVIVGVNTDQYAAFAPYILINVRTNDNGGAACVLYYE